MTRFIFGGTVAALLIVFGRAAHATPDVHSTVSSEITAGTEEGEIRRLEAYDQIDILGSNYWYQFQSMIDGTPFCLQRIRTYLFLLKCNNYNDRQKWHINDSGTVKNKKQYLEQNFCLHVDGNRDVRVRKCLEGSGRQTFAKIGHGDAEARFEAVTPGGGCVAVSGKGFRNYYDETCDSGDTHIFDVVVV
eukprot:CAMPEP_0194298356 /NCGR_PEP_ID=MMETSP0169-20130528/60120_1 /TAXON_ID=218684 /ORGANISM="Corethron pennatum, Strain L29A3" /LENGTH=189 /DNA_ID=CAMNT_0039048333 /DNA_START=405 /DNA_END=974 /DNA_ORIENTATION=+